MKNLTFLFAGYMAIPLLALTTNAQAQGEVHFLMTDRHGHKVARFDYATGEPVSHFVGSGVSPLEYPIGLTYGPDGNLYVVSAHTNSVMRYDGQTGRYLGEFVAPFSGGLTDPRVLAFGPDGNLYVGSWTGNRVLRYDGTTGAFLDTFVTVGSGGMSYPGGMTFGPDGDLYIASLHSHNVKRYDGETGEFVEDYVQWGAAGLDCPAGLVFDNEDRLYIVGNCSSNVVVRHPDRTVSEVVARGSHGLISPEGIAIGPDGALVVTTHGSIANAMRFDRATGAFLSYLGPGGVGGLHADERAHLVFMPEAPPAPGCRADFDGSGSLDFFDFLAFQNEFAAGCP